MSGEASLTRRTLLRRAGVGAALLVGGGVALDRILTSGDRQEILPYLPGFNDDFLTYSTSDFADATMEKVGEAGGRSVRFGIDWGAVQAAGPDDFDWSPYEPLASQAKGAGVQLLPTVFGCPDWAGPVVTAARWTGNDPPYPSESFRTCSPEHDEFFGEFADAALRHFDSIGPGQDDRRLVTAVEILNEPNIWTFGAVPASRLAELSSAAAEKVSASQTAGDFSGEMRVISGGIAPVAGLDPGNPQGYPARPSWQQYLTELVGSGSGGFDVGVHSYDTSKPPAGTLTIPEDNPSDPYARAGQFATWQASRIIGMFDQAQALTSRDLWLTETGASSASTWSEDIFSPGYRAAHGQTIQADVLTQVADGLRSRPRCKAMIVHRLFSNDLAEPPPTPESDSPHYQDGVYESIDGQAKLAVSALAAAWP